MSDLLVSTSSTDYNIIILTETWLDNTINSLEFISNRYITYRKDREQSSIPNKRGGGVLIAVQPHIISNEYVNIKMKDLESVCVVVPTLNGNIYIYSAYIQYGSNIEAYRAHIAAISELKSTMNESDLLIICGDFNMSGIKWNENDSGFDYHTFQSLVIHNQRYPTYIGK